MTPKEREVMELALEALEELNNTNSYWWQEVDEQTIKKIDPAITAIKEALAQPEQKPVAVVDANDEGYWADILPDQNVKVGQFLYTTPPYVATPRQRTWVGLTKKDMDWLHENTPCIEGNYGYRFIKAIEAKLKEKNTK